MKEHWGLAQLQKHLLQEDLLENCLREQGLLTQTMPANRELLSRRDAFLGPMGRWWRVFKELEAASEELAAVPLSHLFQESCVVDSAPPHRQPPRAGRVGQEVVQSTGSTGGHIPCISLFTGLC